MAKKTPIYQLSKAEYAKWAGLDRGTLTSHADTFGTPTRDHPVDVVQVVRWLHRYLIENRKLLCPTTASDDDPLADQQDKDWRMICYQLRAAHLEDDLRVRRGNLVPREQIHEILETWATLLRQYGTTLNRLGYHEAHKLLLDCLDDCETAVNKLVDRYERNGAAVSK